MEGGRREVEGGRWKGKGEGGRWKGKGEGEVKGGRGRCVCG